MSDDSGAQRIKRIGTGLSFIVFPLMHRLYPNGHSGVARSATVRISAINLAGEVTGRIRDCPMVLEPPALDAG
jgi:hypothetical protein